MRNRGIVDGTLLVNRYEIQGYINAGGMQEVYLGYDKVLNRKVAIKTPFSKSAMTRFNRSAILSAQVNHPNVAATIDYFKDGDREFLVEELIEGIDLEKRLSDEFFCLDPHLAAHVIHHISRSLQAAHRVGIFHRDLKPSNIMTSADPGMQSIKLTDFGIAKMANDELVQGVSEFGKKGTVITGSKTLLGALPYMAPECWRNWSSASYPMDIWALGAIGYHLLAGQTPFGDGVQAIVATLDDKFVLSKPSWFGTHKQSELLENSLWELIMQCMSRDLSKRPTAEQVVKMCSAMCYSNNKRVIGRIYRYAADGGSFGFITEENTNADHFFHSSEYYSLSGRPSVNQKVSFSIYPGIPNPRVAPVLLLK